MRPPECAVCGRTDPATRLVRFALDGEARAWRVRAREEGFVGHPPDEEWFCGRHLSAAEALSHRTRLVALRMLCATVEASDVEQP